MQKQFLTVQEAIVQNKRDLFLSQAQTVFNYLRRNIATASMVSEATGIKQKNICRFKRNFEKAGLLWEIRKGNCKITSYKAWYLTTDPSKVFNQGQKQLEFTFD